MTRPANSDHQGESTMKRLISGFGLTLALLFTLGALDPARAAGPFFPPTKGQPGPDGNTLVWRVQILLQVCDYSDAGTDNKVLVALNDSNYTVMDEPHNDFERASTEAYDLRLTGVTRLSDINYLKIYKGGSDGVCISRLDLFVNERLIYSRTLSAALQWLDDEYYSYDSRILPIYGSTLRAHTAWQTWNAPARPRLLTEDEMVSRLATAVGTGIYNFNVASSWDSMSWSSSTCGGGDSPCVERLDNTAIKVRLSLDYKCVDPTFGDGYCGDSVANYWAHLRFACNVGGLVSATLVSHGGDVDGNSNDSIWALYHVSAWVGPRLNDLFRDIQVNYCSTLAVNDLGNGLIEVRLW